jgi:membrane associated rhomboid family serine protease
MSGGIFSICGGAAGVQDKHPRNENFWDMWKFTFCPHFRFCSFTMLLILLQISVFIAEMIHSKVEVGHLSKYNFLGAELKTHQLFGMRMPFAIRATGQVHRLILPFFLHYSFNHLFISILIQMLIGFNFEKIIGTFRLILFWVATVIGGHIFGALVSSNYAIGSDNYVFALFGGMFGVTFVVMCRPDNVPEEIRDRVRC